MPSGAMNPYPMLEWLRESGGVASGGEATPAALGSSVASLPEYCDPFLDAGLISSVAGTVGEMVDGGDAGAAPTSGSGGTGEQVVQEAEKYLGTPYVLGGPEDCVPGEAMDCTCLTTTVFREFGHELPDDPEALMEYGEPVEGEPRAGDVLVWGDPGDGTGGHTAIALGDGRIIHANMATMDTSITPMYESLLYLGARRLVDE